MVKETRQVLSLNWYTCAMLIIHGENTSKSRLKLTELINLAKNEQKEVFTLQAKSLTPALLEESLGGTTLFGSSQLIVIEELHSLPESSKKKQFISLLSNSKEEILLWEKRLLTATMLKKFPEAKVETFKTSNILFQWLDMLGVSKDKKRVLKDLQLIIKDEGAFFCFTMIVRQIRLLIAAVDDGKLSGAPFIVSKLKKQAQSFNLQQLLDIHTKLLEIDYRQKRSLSKLTLEEELDLLILSL